jgi:prepilin-type N-terminal cleavage/methylation domain-containing protein
VENATVTTAAEPSAARRRREGEARGVRQGPAPRPGATAMSDAAPMVRAASAGPAGSGAPRGGFTLVELLAVILIIGLITAIAVPVVIQSLAKARNTAIKAEIDMLHMAIMNYKNEYGSFPPCLDLSGYSSNGPASRHLARLFPRCGNPTATGPNAQFAAATQPITPVTAIVSWLSGYTADPFLPLTNGERKPLYDFDRSRVSSTLAYAPAGKPGAPYVYIRGDQYLWDHDSNPATPEVVRTFSLAGGSYYGHRMPVSGTTILNNPLQPAFNKDTFQILCAGPDEEFGTDDDLSNFWPGTRREYLDSL